MSTSDWERNLDITARVVGSVILRNMRTRFGGSYTAYIIAVIWPYLHLAIIVSVYSLLGRTAPLGTDSVTYFAIAVVPFILYTYPMRGIALSIIRNRPLLYFPRVKVFDILLASIILEALTACVVCFVVLLSLVILGREFEPFDWIRLIGGFAGGLYFGIALGIGWALICSLWQGAASLTNLWIVTFYVTSGVFFLPDVLPEAIRYWASYNPLLQAVELTRTGYYADFHSSVLDIDYLFWMPTVIICISLAGEALFRRFVLTK